MGMMLITHDLGVMAEMCDRVAVMYAGKIVEYADVDSIFYRPRHPYTIGLLKSIPRLGERVEKLATIEGTVPAPTDWPKGCHFCTRCTWADDLCVNDEPQLVEIETGHFVACWHIDGWPRTTPKSAFALKERGASAIRTMRQESNRLKGMIQISGKYQKIDPLPLLERVSRISVLLGSLRSPAPYLWPQGSGPGGGSDGESSHPGSRPELIPLCFHPGPSLVDSSGIRTDLPAALGGSILFSSSGYGLGLFYERKLTPRLSGFVDLTFPAYAEGIELEVYNNNPESVHYQSFFVRERSTGICSPAAHDGRREERTLPEPLLRQLPSFRSRWWGRLSGPDRHTTGASSMRSEVRNGVFAPGGFVGIGAEVTGMNPGVGFSLRYYLIPLDPGVEEYAGRADHRSRGYLPDAHSPILTTPPPRPDPFYLFNRISYHPSNVCGQHPSILLSFRFRADLLPIPSLDDNTEQLCT